MTFIQRLLQLRFQGFTLDSLGGYVSLLTWRRLFAMFWWCWWWRCCSSSELEWPEEDEDGLSTSDTPESAGLGGREPEMQK